MLDHLETGCLELEVVLVASDILDANLPLRLDRSIPSPLCTSGEGIDDRRFAIVVRIVELYLRSGVVSRDQRGS